MDRKTLDRLLSLRRNPRSDNDFSDSDKQSVDALHRSILGSPVRDCSCRNRYADAYYEIMAALPKETRNLIKMSKQQNRYHLKGGYVIYHEGSHYTNVTLTDDIAKAYLAKHPDAAYQFDSIPEPEVQEDNSDIEEAKKYLKESEEDLENHDSEIYSEEKKQMIVAYQDTLREAIQGGDINSISSAVYCLKEAWASAFEQSPTEEKPKEKKSKK
jgi:hypothetical protein